MADNLSAAIEADFAIWLADDGSRVGPLDDRQRLVLRLAFTAGRISGINVMADSLSPQREGDGNG